MPAYNVEMRQRVSGTFADIIYLKANWNHMDNKPTTFAPTSHTHGNITNDGKIGATANLMVKTTTSGVLDTLTAGTTSQYLRGDGTWATPDAGGGGQELLVDVVVGTNTSVVDITGLDLTAGKTLEFYMYIKSSNANPALIGINGLQGSNGWPTYGYTRIRTTTSSTITCSSQNTGFPMSEAYVANTYIRGQLWMGHDNRVHVNLTETFFYNNAAYQVDASHYLNTALTNNTVTSIQIRRTTITSQPDILVGSIIKFWEAM